VAELKKSSGFEVSGYTSSDELSNKAKSNDPVDDKELILLYSETKWSLPKPSQKVCLVSLDCIVS